MVRLRQGVYQILVNLSRISNKTNSEALYASHSIRRDGSTQRNTFASGDTHRALSSTALVDAIQLMNRYKGHSGTELLPTKSLLLVVPKELEATAMRITHSDYGPDVANLGLSAAGPTITAAVGRNIKVVVNPYIPSSYSTNWFLIDTERASKQVFAKWAWQPRMNEHWEYRKGNFMNDASSKFGPLVLGWQWTFGSLGTGAAI